MTDTPSAEWLSLPDVAEALDLKVTRVHRLIEDRALLARRIDGTLRVPAAFLGEGEPLRELRGTIIVLGDAGFHDDEIMDWLLSPEESLGTTPIDALRAGRKTEVRRVAQALAF
ncbi:Rv2175c family DNA-binding protein [Galbitalea sp. SE-J8]|uniref:Rv2175c family DNA-binding protein n=1 Tax=Galbitalea sp. SE-J8 TaxID=3054952 RepID=UPI00259D0544|nr:Rv2175c family DNA-binding protein [Galbitalea sp. SE-J8]MDM4763074.1 Rv2175c family DNA-binding protein [Galbitalea sp. SE-J8]